MFDLAEIMFRRSIRYVGDRERPLHETLRLIIRPGALRRLSFAKMSSDSKMPRLDLM
jgi:hypothetical protein